MYFQVAIIVYFGIINIDYTVYILIALCYAPSWITLYKITRWITKKIRTQLNDWIGSNNRFNHDNAIVTLFAVASLLSKKCANVRVAG